MPSKRIGNDLELVSLHKCQCHINATSPKSERCSSNLEPELQTTPNPKTLNLNSGPKSPTRLSSKPYKTSKAAIAPPRANMLQVLSSLAVVEISPAGYEASVRTGLQGTSLIPQKIGDGMACHTLLSRL